MRFSSFSEGSGSSKLRLLSISLCGRLRETFRCSDDSRSRSSAALLNFGGFRFRVEGRLRKTFRACDDRGSRRASAISNFGGFQSSFRVDFPKRFGAPMIVVLGGLWPSEKSAAFDLALR
ncbi:hypothetical protein NPIL_242741 [Nephila pilipes]|uniref:Uncharacterized protein n=1 Tax=Nephila pilipes TaxID=299642 RepID=A0A8X6ULU5_NEPPI|nr:hypothetical protein NPIL_242741 [Nephila pilipes]